MPDRVGLTTLPIGSTFRLTGRLDAKSAAGVVVTFLRPNGDAVGTLNIAPDGTFTGALTIPPDQAQVEPLAIALALGDILNNLDNGMTTVVRAIGLGPDGALWSPSLNHRPTFPATGWVKVGHVNPDNL
jgi:hypothetical protein